MAEVGLAKLKLSHKVQNTKKGVKEIPKFRGQSPATKPGAQASRWGRGVVTKVGVVKVRWKQTLSQ